MELDAVMPPVTQEPNLLPDSAINEYKALFMQMGKEEGKAGVTMREGPDAPVFVAHQQALIQQMRQRPAMEKAVAEETYKDVQARIADSRADLSQIFAQLATRKSDMALTSKGMWTYKILAITAIVGEIPLAFQMFLSILGGEEALETFQSFIFWIAVLGAIGFVGSTAAVKVVLDWLINRLFRSSEYRETAVNPWNRLTMAAAIVLGLFLFWSFANSVGVFRKDLEAVNAFNTAALLESEKSFEESPIGASQPPTPFDPQAIVALQAKLKESTANFFISFGMLFPFAAGVLMIESEARGRRLRARKKLIMQSKVLATKVLLLEGEMKTAATQLAEKNARLESTYTDGVGDAWRHQFWSAYQLGYLQGTYDPNRFENGPGLFEKVEAFRMKMNHNPILS